VDKIKSYLIVGAICFIVGAALVGGFVYTATNRTAAKLNGVIRNLEQNRAAVDRELRAIGTGIGIAVRELDRSTGKLADSLDSIGRLRTLAERNKALASEILGIAEALGKANQSLRDTEGALDRIISDTDHSSDMGMDRLN